MSFGVNNSGEGGSPFGALGIACFMLFGGLIMLVGECGSCLGIDPILEGTVQERFDRSNEQRQSRQACTHQCSKSYPDTWKEPDATLYNTCFDAC